MTIKKWLPCSMWDFIGLQNWINEQASAGYALMAWPGAWDIGRISFQEDPSARTARYRLEPMDDRMGEQERNELYAQSGWTYITKIHKLYAVYRCDDPEAPELYADPESLSLTLKQLIKRQWIEMILTLIWAGLILREPLANMFTAPALLPLPLILATEILLPLYLAMFAFVAAQLIRTVYRLMKLRRLRRQLASGILPAAGKRRYQASWNNLTALVAILCFVYVIFLGVSGDMRTQYLKSPEEWDFPHVMLSELVPESTELRMYNNQEMLVFDKFKHSLLAPEQYETAQEAMATLPDGTQQEYRLDLAYFRTISPAVAEVMYYGKIAERQKTLEAYRKSWEENSSILYNNEPNPFGNIRQETLDNFGLDDLYVFTYLSSDREHPAAYYVGRCGEQVFTLSCSGGIDSEAALELLTERLMSQSFFGS